MIYFELLHEIRWMERIVAPGFYCTSHNSHNALPWKLIANCETVWEEHPKEGLRYLKNRYHGMSHPVDMDKFFWVKLSAKELV